MPTHARTCSVQVMHIFDIECVCVSSPYWDRGRHKADSMKYNVNTVAAPHAAAAGFLSDGAF